MSADAVCFPEKEEAAATRDWCADRAAIYAALAELYSRPLTGKWLSWFASPDFPCFVRSFAAGDNTDSALLEEGLTELQESVEGKNISELMRELQAEHSFLFILGARETVHPYASVYLSEWKRVMGEAWEKARIFMHEAGFGLPEEKENKQLEDHLSVELEFMQLLCRAAGKATRRKKKDRFRESLKLQESFLRDHLLTWVPKYCADMARVSQHRFYRAMAKITMSFLALEAAALKQLCEE
jgi:TorA-specific chaperone